VKSLIAAILCFLAWPVLAQDEVHVSGRLVDSESGEPLAFAAVTVHRTPSGDLVSGAVTDDAGRFGIIGIPEGQYLVRFTYLGYEAGETDLLVGELNRNFDLGTIPLARASQDLDEVTVRAERPDVSPDMEKKTVYMDENIAGSGGSVLDAMRTMPGVTVDQEGRVILRGSDRVVVLIDGKQSSLTGFGNQRGLDNIPAANIERIEIITNPSARYDAAGMAGIINIVYRKERETGFNGDAGLAMGLGALTRPREDLPTDLGSYAVNPKLIPGVNVNYRRDKVNFFLQSEAMFLKGLPNNEFTTRTYDDGQVTRSQVPENRTQQHYILKGGADVFFNGRNTLTLSGIYDWESHVDTAQVAYIDGQTDERYRYITWHEEEITGFMNYSARFKHNFIQPGHVLDAYAQYTRGWEDETYYINDSSYVREGRDVTSVLGVEHIVGLELDYTKPLSSGRLEAGGKLQVRRLPVDYEARPGPQTMLYPGLGNWSDWGENIYAGYVNFIHESPSYDIEAGIRAEQTEVFYEMDPENIYYSENDAYDYFGLYPAIRLSYKPHPDHRISVFYNRRVDRPGEPELRMFAKSDDHELLKVGNPYLRPQFTQSFELAYRFKWESGSVYLAGYYRMIDDPFMRVYTADTSNAAYDVIVKIYANTGSATNAGAEGVFSQQLFGLWKLTGNANYYRNTIHSHRGSLLFPYPHDFRIEESQDNTFDLKLNNQFDIGQRWQVQLTALYLAPKNIPQGRQLSRSSVDLGILLRLFGSRGELRFSASDIFNTYGIRQEISGEGFSALYENFYETQVFRLGFKYKF
jgi:outer membrane receptor protein involved in Fe transport